MTKFLFFLPALLLFGFTSCKSAADKGEKSAADTDSAKENTFIPVLGKDFKRYDLKKYGFNASIMAPKDAYFNGSGDQQYTTIRLTEFESKMLEIIPIDMQLNEITKALESPSDEWYTRKHLYSDENSVFYELTSKKEVKEHNKIAYNFIMVTTINGKVFHFKASSEQDFSDPKSAYSKEEVLTLYAMAKSLKIDGK